MMLNLKGKVALVTGGSRGIGRATALMFAEAGCDVAVNYLSNEKAAREVEAAGKRHGVRMMPVKADLADKTQVGAMVDTVIKQLGRLDILVNNGGVWKEAAIEEMTDAQLRETVDINLNGVFFAIRAAVPQMKRQRSGNIINISSTAGQRGEAFHSHYAATKGAVISLTKSLAPELAPYNIRVNCVAPGWVATDMTYESLDAPDADKIFSLIPLGRVGTPEEIAGAVLFLASDLSTFITGEILNVNGGAVLCG
jgi:3-oxoacyl-[acyl-carrier protein] reductase